MTHDQLHHHPGSHKRRQRADVHEAHLVVGPEELEGDISQDNSKDRDTSSPHHSQLPGYSKSKSRTKSASAHTDVVELNSSTLATRAKRCSYILFSRLKKSSSVLQTTPGREHPFHKSRPSQDWVAGTHLGSGMGWSQGERGIISEGSPISCLSGVENVLYATLAFHLSNESPGLLQLLSRGHCYHQKIHSDTSRGPYFPSKNPS